MYRYRSAPNMYSFGPGGISSAIKAIIWANVGVFVLTMLVPHLVIFFGLTPAAVFESFRLWQPITYLFVHGDLSHILFNMLALWMFGVELERLWGTEAFLKYYFVTGLGAAATTLIVSLLPIELADRTYYAVTIGASGAVYGLLLAFALYYPDRPIYLFFLFPIPAKYFVMIIGAIAFLSVPQSSGVAHIAQLGGLVVGYLYLQQLRGLSAGRLGLGRLGVMADIKYRYVKWKMGRLRKRFDVHSGGRDNWEDRIH